MKRFIVLLCAILASLSAAEISCSECQAVMEVAVKLGENATTLAEFVALLEKDGCGTVFAKKAIDKDICDEVVKLAGKAIPAIDNGLNQLAWKIPLGFCSVFVPVCKDNLCCDAATPTRPEQLRITPTGDVSSMSVTWITLKSTKTSIVQWGAAGQALVHNSTQGYQRTYPFGGWVGQIHTAVMTGLKAGQSYSYRVGDTATGDFSQAFTFRNLPAAGDPVRVVQIGDMGFSENATINALTKQAQAGNIDVLIHVGDIGYADGFETHWDVYGRKTEPFTAIVPSLFAPGNHEFWQNFTAYKHRFFNPLPGNGLGRDAMYYGLDITPNLHIAMLNTESDIDLPQILPAQKKWVSADLQKARQGMPNGWLVTAGHRPLYCTSPGTVCKGESQYLRDELEAAFLDSAVDLHIQCHVHDYERTWPTSKGQVTQKSYNQPGAPVYIVNGAAGNREGNAAASGKEPWSAARNSTVGYGRFTVSAKELEWQFVDSASGAVLDSFTIVK